MNHLHRKTVLALAGSVLLAALSGGPALAAGFSGAAPMFSARAFHSDIMLLDGRVLSAGGNVGGPNAQLFSPPYLFAGVRPAIA